ncbi:synaptic vesicle membrane protein VAT-1 homolog-like isoform X2 [Convolutriloba macropyga]|uniref:synaptic vesicle membrane protein VAT-1 homolog-like isoform X2 n=1 Tax=Convolutriloba macropyga TaxID=536237 RepID=UPI003F51C19B
MFQQSGPPMGGNAQHMDPSAGMQPQGGSQVPATPDMKEMRSVVLTGFGNLSKVKVYKSPQPMVGPGEVLIRVQACGMNFNDLLVRQGVTDNLPNTPLILGYECAGYVEELGDGAEGFPKGAPVIALTRFGSMAEYVVAPVNRCYRMPQGMSFEDGAALLLNYVTAYLILFHVVSIKKDKIALIHSAGGGVGCACAQLCNLLENVTLIGTATKEKHSQLRKMGLYTYLFDRYQEDYVEEVKRLSPYGVDIVLDSLSGEDVAKGISLTKPMGHYVLYGSSSSLANDLPEPASSSSSNTGAASGAAGAAASVTSQAKHSILGYTKHITHTPLSKWLPTQKVNQWWLVEKVNPIKLFDDNRSVGGFNLINLLFDQGQHQLVQDVVKDLFKLYKEGKIKPVIDSTWAMEEVTDAMTRMQEHKNVGKILLVVGQMPRNVGEQNGPDLR